MPAAAPPDKTALIAQARAIAGRNRTPGLSQQAGQAGGLSITRAKYLFGGWNAFVAAAGLRPDTSKKRIDDDELLSRVRDACVQAGGLVSCSHVLGARRRHRTAYRARWGDWRNVLFALRDWCEVHDPGFAHLEALPRRGGPALPKALHAWPPPPRRYGAPLNFRGVLHEPVNEPGVILLFGVLAEELGFVIESVQAGFPDCEAKRRTGESWERVRIEFEYESRSFKAHNHDPLGCDLIVCWSHNWGECPVEVLELRAEVARLGAR